MCATVVTFRNIEATADPSVFFFHKTFESLSANSVSTSVPLGFQDTVPPLPLYTIGGGESGGLQESQYRHSKWIKYMHICILRWHLHDLEMHNPVHGSLHNSVRPVKSSASGRVTACITSQMQWLVFPSSQNCILFLSRNLCATVVFQTPFLQATQQEFLLAFSSELFLLKGGLSRDLVMCGP